jgi:hypothetical protein
MPKTFLAMAVAALAFATMPAPTLAHEGHEHKIMGKVVTIDEQKIEVESTDGQKVTGVLSADTQYLRDKAAARRTDVKVGERVVIVVVEDKDKVQNVKRVLLGAAASAPAKQ